MFGPVEVSMAYPFSLGLAFDTLAVFVPNDHCYLVAFIEDHQPTVCAASQNYTSHLSCGSDKALLDSFMDTLQFLTPVCEAIISCECRIHKLNISFPSHHTTTSTSQLRFIAAQSHLGILFQLFSDPRPRDWLASFHYTPCKS